MKVNSCRRRTGFVYSSMLSSSLAHVTLVLSTSTGRPSVTSEAADRM